MATQAVVANATFSRAARDNFIKTWEGKFKATKEDLGSIMQIDIPTSEREPLFAEFLTAPHPTIWPRGDSRGRQNFQSRSFSVVTRNWNVDCYWFEDDRRHDQTRSLVKMARQSGEYMGLLHWRVASQIITGATDALLLPAAPNAPDGQALYATTNDGSTARYGVTGGNVVTGNLVSGTGILTDFFNAYERFFQFQDMQGQPLFSGIKKDLIVWHNPSLTQVFNEQFLTKLVTGGSGAENAIHASGIKVRLIPNQKLTDNDWYIFMDGIPEDQAPLFSTLDQSLREVSVDATNSDECRDKKMEGLLWDSSMAFGVNEPYSTIKINN